MLSPLSVSIIKQLQNGLQTILKPVAISPQEAANSGLCFDCIVNRTLCVPAGYYPLLENGLPFSSWLTIL